MNAEANTNGRVQRAQEALERAVRAEDPGRAVAEALKGLWPQAPLAACWLTGPPQALAALDGQGQPLGGRAAALDRALRRWCASADGRCLGSLRAPRGLPCRGDIRLARLSEGPHLLGGLAVAFPPEFPPEAVTAAEDLLAGLAGFLSLRIRLDRALAGPAPGAHPDQALALGDMLGPVAHSVHNLLNGVVLQSAILTREVPEALREKVTFFRLQALRASQLFGVLDRYRYALRPTPAVVGVNQVVASAVTRCREEGIPVDYRPGANVPDVLADEEGLARLAWLLAHNAHAAMTPSADSGPVAVRTARGKGHAVLTVQDGGPRLKRDELEAFFDPMTLPRGAEEPLERVACRGLVDRFHGILRAKNLPRGLAVTVELPAHSEG